MRVYQKFTALSYSLSFNECEESHSDSNFSFDAPHA